MQKPDHQSRTLRAFAPALVLLVISFLINYVDRGNLSIAAPLLSAELDLSPAKLGILLSVFFWTYTLMQFVMGWLVDNFNVNRILAAGFLVWSLATATTGLVRGARLCPLADACGCRLRHDWPRSLRILSADCRP